MSIYFDFEAEQEMARKATGLSDWHYRDLPKMGEEFFNQFIKIVGEENILWITKATYPNGTKRGQLMISPKGMENIRIYNERVKNGKVH